MTLNIVSAISCFLRLAEGLRDLGETVAPHLPPADFMDGERSLEPRRNACGRAAAG
jgi:hypothetical protein